MPWLILSLLFAAIIIIYAFLGGANHGKINAVITYNYDGVEQGLDPAGNRFDAQEIKQDQLIQTAAEAVGLAEDNETLENLKTNLTVSGTVPYDWINRIINYRSIITEDGVASTTDVRESSFFPTSYNLSFDYQAAGMAKSKGWDFLSALLSAYHDYFYRFYGFNHSLKDTIDVLDYTEYEYFYSTDVLKSNLKTVRDYLANLERMDYTRFRSSETGISFADLVDTADTIESEDIDWITYYVDSNSVSKDRNERLAYLNYRIEALQREKEAQEKNLDTLNELIDSYTKTNAMFISLGSSGMTSDGELQEYQFSQHSDAYDSLINRRIALLTRIREIQENISLQQIRIARLEKTAASGKSEIVAQKMDQVDQKIRNLLSMTERTATEYYRNVKLKDAVDSEMIELSSLQQILSTGKQAFPILASAEGITFGLYLLFAAFHGLQGTNRRFAFGSEAQAKKKSFLHLPLLRGKQSDGRKNKK